MAVIYTRLRETQPDEGHSFVTVFSSATGAYSARKRSVP
jgi:hypothetical protein